MVHIAERLTPDRVRPGDRYYKDTVTFEVVEVNKTADIRGMSIYIIAYRIIDHRGNRTFTSPVAHLFVTSGEDVKKHIMKVIDDYIKLREQLLSAIR